MNTICCSKVGNALCGISSGVQHVFISEAQLQYSIHIHVSVVYRVPRGNKACWDCQALMVLP